MVICTWRDDNIFDPSKDLSRVSWIKITKITKGLYQVGPKNFHPYVDINSNIKVTYNVMDYIFTNNFFSVNPLVVICPKDRKNETKYFKQLRLQCVNI